MKPARFHPEARSEMIDAARYYEEQREGLGKRFLAAVDTARRSIQIQPRLYRETEDSLRKCRVRRFPYGIVFRELPAEIEILAVSHFKRRPGYWKYRMR